MFSKFAPAIDDCSSTIRKLKTERRTMDLEGFSGCNIVDRSVIVCVVFVLAVDDLHIKSLSEPGRSAKQQCNISYADGLHTPHVPPSFAQCLQYLQFLQALHGLAPVQVANAV